MIEEEKFPESTEVVKTMEAMIRQDGARLILGTSFGYFDPHIIAMAKKVNPKVTVQLVFTGEWSMPVREAESTNALVDAGCDVIACNVDSPKAVLDKPVGNYDPIIGRDELPGRGGIRFDRLRVS